MTDLDPYSYPAIALPAALPPAVPPSDVPPPDAPVHDAPVPPAALLRLTSLAALLAATAAVVIERDLPGLGVVRIKQLSVAEYDDVRGRTKADAPASEFGLALTAYALVDDAGHPLLSQGDLQPLRAAAGTKVDALVGAVLDVNGYKRAGSPN